jgi:HPt (histidine-containing phosphotransfer) domain-containing protein
MTAQEISSEIIAAISAGQIDAVIAAAHKLSSSALTIGALDLGALCRSIEDAGKARDQALLNTLQLRFEDEWTEVNKLLEAWPR